MTAEEGLEWRPGRSIPWREISFSFDTSGGPGGQHANRSATRVTLRWRPAESEALTEGEKRRLSKALASRLSADGVLQIRASAERQVSRNKEECLEALARLLRDALRRRRARIRTRPPRAAKEKRLENKRRRSRIKEKRKPPTVD